MSLHLSSKHGKPIYLLQSKLNFPFQPCSVLKAKMYIIFPSADKAAEKCHPRLQLNRLEVTHFQCNSIQQNTLRCTVYNQLPRKALPWATNSFLSPPYKGINQKHLTLVQSFLENAVAVGMLSIPEVSQALLSLQKVRPFQAGRNIMFVLWPK